MQVLIYIYISFFEVVGFNTYVWAEQKNAKCAWTEAMTN